MPSHSHRRARRLVTLCSAPVLVFAAHPSPAQQAVLAQQACPSPAPLPALPAEPPPVGDTIEVTSDGAEVTAEGDALLSGRVRVRQGERVLSADDARYDAARQSFAVDGNVEYRDSELRVSGDSALWLPDGGGRFGNAAFELPARPARGRAGTIELGADERLALEAVEYTTCPLGQDDWLLRARRIDIDPDAQQGSARDVRLEFLGVPILWSPVIWFPVGDARQSGFLFPTFGRSNRKGVELGLPWYWNIAPNYDATLRPSILTRRGLALDGEFRYLTPRSRGQFDGSWVPDDRQTDESRAYVHLVNTTDLLPRLRFEALLANATDPRWFEDFGAGPEGTSVVALERVLRFTYLDQHWRAIAQVQQFQVIDRSIDPLERPYARLPQLLVRGRWGGSTGPGLELRGEAAYFHRDVGVTGARFDLEPTASWAWRAPGAFLVPAVGLRGTQYLLDRTAAGSDEQPSRAVPSATLDAGLLFERTAGRRVQTLEPRLLYTWVPFRDQDALPVFDTGTPDLNLVQLFRTQRYVGGDRVGDVHQVALGATTRVVDVASGRQLLSGTLGQVYYLDRPRVRLPDEPPLSAGTSDVIAQLVVSAFGRWSVQLGHQWDPQERRSVRSEVGVQYAAGGGRVLSLGYRFRTGLLEQVDGAVSWPVLGNWRLYAAHVYSLRDQTSIESLGGIEYAACCWRVQLLGRRYVSSRAGARDTAVSLQLELAGLSSVGTPELSFEGMRTGRTMVVP